MSMIPFLDHAAGCRVCRARPDLLCVIGKRLWREGQERLLSKIDPAKRPQA
jgi:hypothetical protein